MTKSKRVKRRRQGSGDEAKPARLTSIRIEAFRSCISTKFQPHPELSVLIGPNGAGKTNVLQAILLLASAASSRFVRRLQQTSTARCKILASFETPRSILRLRCALDYALTEDNREVVVRSRIRWQVAATNRLKAGEWREVPFALVSNSIDASYMEGIRFVRRSFSYRVLPAHELSRQEIEAATSVSALLSKVSYYSASKFANPTKCPSSFEVDEKGNPVVRPLRPASHQRFLSDLYSLKERNQTKYESFLSLVGPRGLQLLDRISWKEIKVASSQVEVKTGGKILRKKRERLLIVPSLHLGSDRLSFSQLSEGSFRTLALIFYLITDENQLMLIEEPEVSVHHGLLASLIELIKNETSQKQIILSTHSDFVLDHLSLEHVFSVSRERNHGTVVRKVVTEYPRQTVESIREFLRESGNLGEFWRQGGLDR